MSNTVLYIDENDIKDFTSIQNNVNPKLLTPYILDAQVLYIDDFLGIALKTELDNQILSGTTAITQDMTNLLEKIKPALIYYTWYEAIPFMRAKFTDKGIVIKNSDNSTDVTEEHEIRLGKTVLNKAEKYMSKLKYFMEANEALYPNWPINQNCKEVRSNKDSGFDFCGIQF